MYSKYAATLVMVATQGEGSGTLAQGIPEIRVLVYNLASEPEATRNRALAEAQRLFRDVGIVIRWVDCASTSDQMFRFPGCRVEGMSTVFLRIVGSPAPGFVRLTALGFTVPAEQGAVYATVFRDRVRLVAANSRCSAAVILGVAIAHELGHVLLGTTGHAPNGLMGARWSVADLHLAEVGLLRFRPQEAAQMRSEVVRRNSSH